MDEELVDPRRNEPAFVAGERAVLQAWLAVHRTGPAPVRPAAAALDLRYGTLVG